MTALALKMVSYDILSPIHTLDTKTIVADLFVDLAKQPPVFAPKQKSTYSNINFELLGLVIENVTGVGYAEYVQRRILQPLGMCMSGFVPSNDSFAVLPYMKTRDEWDSLGNGNYWDTEEGVMNP